MLASASFGTAHASVQGTFQQVGSDVIFDLSGTLDLTGSTASFGYVSQSDGLFQGNPAVISTGAVGASQTLYSGFSGPAQFGANSTEFDGISSGDAIFFDSSDLWLPANYVSGGQLNASVTFANTQLSAFDLPSADAVFTLPSGDTVTLKGLVSSAPEPASWALMIVGLGAIGGALRRRVTRVTYAA